MSKTDILDIQTYQFSEHDRLLLDTNIWLHIYASKIEPSGITVVYQHAFARMLAAKSLLFIEMTIISEFISNYARLRNLKAAKQFKTFRNSKDFQMAAKMIVGSGREILSRCQLVANNIAKSEIASMLANLEHGCIDFNDQVLLALCKYHQLTLVTDDGDFKNADCKVLTANPKLLN